LKVSKTVEEADLTPMTPGTAGTGQENEELIWGRRHIGRDDPAPPQTTGTGAVRLVDRVTGLHDIGPAPGVEPVPVKHPSRAGITGKIRSCDDAAVHCREAREISDRLEEVTEALLCMINDLQYRMDDIEYTQHRAETHEERPGTWRKE
jgi:hypothetical protein